MNKKKILVFTLSLLVAGLLVAPALALSNTDLWGNATVKGNVESGLGLGTKDIRTTISTIINGALGLLGIVSVVIVLIGGFEWMTAGGNEEKTGEAKKRIMAGVIGLAIILSAYAIATFVVNTLVNAT